MCQLPPTTSSGSRTSLPGAVALLTALVSACFYAPTPAMGVFPSLSPPSDEGGGAPAPEGEIFPHHCLTTTPALAHFLIPAPATGAFPSPSPPSDEGGGRRSLPEGEIFPHYRPTAAPTFARRWSVVLCSLWARSVHSPAAVGIPLVTPPRAGCAVRYRFLRKGFRLS